MIITKRLSILTVTLLVAAVALMSVSHAATDPPKADAKPVLAPMNNYQAYAYGVSAAHQAKSEQCESKTDALKTMAAKCTTDMCLAYFADKVDRSCDSGQGGGQIAMAQPPAPEKPWYVEIKDTILDTARVALPVVDRVMTSRDNRLARESSERQTLGLYGTFSGMHSASVTGLTNLGTAGINGVRDTALGGFGSMERGYEAAFKNPTYSVTVNGSDNALFGSTSTRTYANNCTGGNGGPSGDAGSGGNGGQNGGGGASAAAPGGSGGSAPCSIQK